MGGKDFCALLQQLREAAPALQPQEVPTLHAFSALAAEFHPVGASEASGALPNGIADKTGPKEPQYKAKEAPKSAWTKPDSLVGAPLQFHAYGASVWDWKANCPFISHLNGGLLLICILGDCRP